MSDLYEEVVHALQRVSGMDTDLAYRCADAAISAMRKWLFPTSREKRDT